VENPLAKLLERLKESRYALSVTLTGEERRAQPEPTYGGKGTARWLTDEERTGLIAALEDACRSVESKREPIVPQWCPYCHEPHGVQTVLPIGVAVPVIPAAK
jgi:hypothetical protein